MRQRGNQVSWALAGLCTALGAAAGLGACKSDGECTRDSDCGAAQACTAQMCVTRLGAEPLSLAVELEPPPRSVHARRDHPEVIFGAAPVALELDGTVAIRTLVDSPLALANEKASSVRAVLGVPSLLPGRPELSFEVDAANRGGAQPYEVGIEVPSAVIGRGARLTVSPLAPLDQVLCPWMLDVTVTPTSQLILPTVTDSLVLEGAISTPTAPGVPVPTHEARLFVGDRLLSNVGRTGTDGKFVLRAQRSLVVGHGDTMVEITPLDMPGEPGAPPSGSGGAPIILRVPYVGQPQLGLLKIPPAPDPMPFKVAVRSLAGDLPVAGATVRFVTRLEGASVGEAHYMRVGQTGADGVATIPLLLGTGNGTRDYAVSVMPPADGDVSGTCVPSYAVAGGTGAPAFGAALRLPAKAVLEGQIKRLDGVLAPGMRVRAVRVGDAAKGEGCGALPAAAAENTANREGRYRLRVEPGDYRLELQPPLETALPRHTIALVAVAGSTHLDVTLPEAILLEGRVVPAAGSLVPLSGRTEVRVFRTGPAADGALLGSALAGANGQFRLVVPRPAP